MIIVTRLHLTSTCSSYFSRLIKVLDYGRSFLRINILKSLHCSLKRTLKNLTAFKYKKNQKAFFHQIFITELYFPDILTITAACGSVGAMLQAGRSRVRVPVRWIFFNLPNPSSRTMALGSTQPFNRYEYQESSWGGGG
jgi:hypothetical protein